MSTQVSWHLVVAIKEGRNADFNVLKDEMITSTQAEQGTLSYEWSIGDDNTTVHIYERYTDSAATMTHITSFGNFAERFVDILDVVALNVYGSPSDEVRGALAGFEPAYLASVGGFVR